MIDLEALPAGLGLPEESASVLAYRAALAMQRRHRPGVRLTGSVNGQELDEEIRWRERNYDPAQYEDMNKLTEEGAEAIALALAHIKCSFRVVRRLQSRHAERADWLLVDPQTGSKLILEVGGTDEQPLAALLARKLAEAKQSPFASHGTPAACVVQFRGPCAILRSEHGSR